MSHTIYWQRPVELPAAAFAAAVGDIRRALPDLNIPLAGFDGTGSPLLEEDHIVFNGAAPVNCEPFEIRRVEFDRRGRSMVRSFCKTEHLPYDIAVRVALIVLKHHLGSRIMVTADGATDGWRPGQQLSQHLLGYGADFEPDDEDERP